jgi:hypothetical protein
MPYEKRILDMIKSGGSSAEKRIYKFSKKRVRTQLKQDRVAGRVDGLQLQHPSRLWLKHADRQRARMLTIALLLSCLCLAIAHLDCARKLPLLRCECYSWARTVALCRSARR